MFVRLSAPVAAATPSTAAASATVDAARVLRRKSVTSRDWLRVVVPSVEVCPPLSPKWNRPPPSPRPPPPWPGPACAPVTVRSVPTPYTDARASACASRTPAESAFTTITRAIAIARPVATIAVCLRRPESSRRRYVQYMVLLPALPAPMDF